MILQRRIHWLSKLGNYMMADEIPWEQAKQTACAENRWFTPEFVDVAVNNIVRNFLQTDKLTEWTGHYAIQESREKPQTIGIVMAGNIPFVGFHDFLSVFVSGHKAVIKPSSKDEALIKHIAGVLVSWEPEINQQIQFSEILKNCDAYIATGSNNTSRYFEYYFSKYPHIIRRNKTSVAILNGQETTKDLEKLADDVYQFFGLGCRNVTKVYVPVGYDFMPMLSAFKKYDYLVDHYKYKNNYDYNLTLHILNKKFYMTNGSILLTEDPSIFSPISQLNFEYYSNSGSLFSSLNANDEIQCIVGRGYVPFGQAQSPGLYDYADKVDTMRFLNSL